MQVWRGVRLGRPFGIPLVVHGSWFPAALLLACILALEVYDSHGLPSAIWLSAAATFGVFLSLLVHELVHAQTARSIGVPVRDVTLFIFGGVARINREPSRPAQDAAIAASGPAASLVLGAGLLLAAGDSDTGAVLRVVGWANVVVALFNLLPGYPLDGGRLLRAWLWSRSDDPHRSSIRAAIVGQVFAVLLIVVGLVVAWRRQLGEALWLPVVGGFLYVLASSARRASRITSRLSRQPAADYARPITGTLTGDESAAYVRSSGGGPYAVSSGGRLDGVLLPSAFSADVDPFARVRDLMVPWSPRISCSHRLPMSRALEKLSVAADGVLIVVDDAGAVVGVLDHPAVRARLEATV
ncbi:MAG TPA: site-2 protease family protein [Actinomycetota bacterium]|nr:site-2 protease family protein [Actinomycetota bacterium]